MLSSDVVSYYARNKLAYYTSGRLDSSRKLQLLSFLFRCLTFVEFDVNKMKVFFFFVELFRKKYF